MDTYHNARIVLRAKLQVMNEKAKTLDDEWEKIEQGHKDLQERKYLFAKGNGGSQVSDLDILDINTGGQIVQVRRGTLTQIKGTRLEAIFSGRWEKMLHRDANGRVFLDVNPTCFKSIVDYLKELSITSPENPPGLPKADPEDQIFLDGLLTAFGLGVLPSIDSEILTDGSHLDALQGFLAEDNLDQGLTLLYRRTRDGMTAADFHQKCDNKGPTVTVVKTPGDFIFGGFSDLSWDGSVNAYQPSQKAFLFGLRCQGGGHPVKVPVKKDHPKISAVYQNSSYGPTFGAGHDLHLNGTTGGASKLGHSYVHANPSFFTGTQIFVVEEVEVFALCQPIKVSSQLVAPSIQSVSLDGYPEDIRLSFHAETEALQLAAKELLDLADALSKEQEVVKHFCEGTAEDIVFLNVGGHKMAVKHSTLATYPDSVFYKQFVDKNWNDRGKRKLSRVTSPMDWESQEVAAWSQKISGLSEDISCLFGDITGAELLAFGREDIKDLGITRPGSVALVVDAIQKLRKVKDESSATFIEHSDYCIGKIIDHMRLKAMKDLDVPDPTPPKIRDQDIPRFKRIVEYYFPNQASAADFLV